MATNVTSNQDNQVRWKIILFAGCYDGDIIIFTLEAIKLKLTLIFSVRGHNPGLQVPERLRVPRRGDGGGHRGGRPSPPPPSGAGAWPLLVTRGAVSIGYYIALVGVGL